MILLTTAFNGGDDESQLLTHVRVREVNIFLPGPSICLWVERGYVDSGNFVESDKPRIQKHMIDGTEYNTIVTKLTSAADVLIYDEVAREWYQWLIDQGHYVGTIV